MTHGLLSYIVHKIYAYADDDDDANSKCTTAKMGLGSENKMQLFFFGPSEENK